MRFVYYLLEIQLPYKLTTFFIIAKVSLGKTFYLLRWVGGLMVGCSGVCRKNKKLKIGGFLRNIVYLCDHEKESCTY